VEESIEYFHSRPIAKQISATISPQSQPILGREFLNEKEVALNAQTINCGQILEKPQHW
jgi:pyridoxine/pyridoxamine 5'-phosphate oxidase